jgi:DNA anti-recombination protein RmuC
MSNKLIILMDMSRVLLEDILEDELLRAFEVKDREALKRYVKVVVESFSEKNDVKELGYEVKEGFKLISKDMLMISDRLMELKEEISGVKEETEKEISEVRSDIKLLIEMMNKRFEEQREYTDKRFQELMQYADKRFEEQKEYTDKKFEELLHYSDKRFEDMNRRFEEIIHYSDKRFDDMNKKFNLLTWLIGIGFTVVTVLITVFRFIH